MEIIKVLFSAGVFITAIVGIFKYFYEKNREIYIRRLSEVYAPLFSCLIKQETIRFLYLKDSKITDSPILTLKQGKENSTEKRTIIDRNIFVEMLKDINKGLIKPKLLKFMSAYEVLIFLEETVDPDSPEYKIATEKKVEVEYKLFKEVQIGYKQTVQKLKLDKENEIDDLEKFVL